MYTARSCNERGQREWKRSVHYSNGRDRFGNPETKLLGFVLRLKTCCLWCHLSQCFSTQVELRSYVSEPELAMIGGDLSQPSSGFITVDSGYQTLPTRGKPGINAFDF